MVIYTIDVRSPFYVDYFGPPSIKFADKGGLCGLHDFDFSKIRFACKLGGWNCRCGVVARK